MKNKKTYGIITVFIIILIVIITIVLWSSSKSQSALSSDCIAYTDIVLKSESLQLKGILTSSSGYLKSYDYEIKGSKVYLSFFQGGISAERKSGNVDVLIEDDFSNIEEIYQLDSNGHYDLIWTKDKVF